MRILVTGGAGFLGSHLVDLLLADGHHVTVVDNLVTGSTRNLAHIRTRRLILLRRDVTRTPLDEYDRIYNLASPASPVSYERLQRVTLLTNALGTLRTLRIAQRTGARYVQASTSEVYGDPITHPQHEGYWGNVNPIGPRSAYDEGKRFAEALTIAFVREAGVDARIVRIFNSYGPRMRLDDGRMPPAFIAAAVRGQPIRIEGTGQQSRSLCFATDTVAGIHLAMTRGASGRVYNIGRANEVTVAEFARTVKRAAGSTSRIVHVPGRPEDVQRRRPDSRRARRELGWIPKVTLREGLRRTIVWFREQAAPRV